MSFFLRLVFFFCCTAGSFQSPARLVRIWSARPASVLGLSPPSGPNTVSIASMRYTSAELWQVVNALTSSSSSRSPRRRGACGCGRPTRRAPSGCAPAWSASAGCSRRAARRRRRTTSSGSRCGCAFGSWLRVQTRRNSLTSSLASSGCAAASCSIKGKALSSSFALRCRRATLPASLGRSESSTAATHSASGAVLMTSATRTGRGMSGRCCIIIIRIIGSSSSVPK